METNGPAPGQQTVLAILSSWVTVMFRRIQLAIHSLVVPPVVSGLGAYLQLESGTLSSLDNARRVAVIASWDAGNVMSLSLSRYVESLAKAGYTSLVVFTGKTQLPLVWPHGLAESAVVVRRRNIGYDFGSWAAALNAVPAIRSADHVLLTNDSMVGPFESVEPILRRIESSAASVTTLTDSFQIGHSLQSYFMHFKDGILDDLAWRHFFDGVRSQKSKMDVVYKYERAVARECVAGAYGWQALYPATALKVAHENSAIVAWQDLLDLGFPFVKRTLWNEPSLAAEAQKAGLYLKETRGVNVQDWLPLPVAETVKK